MKELKIDFEETDIIELKRLFNTEDENEAVRKAIKEILKKNVYENILSLKGNVNWEGDLDEMRQQRL
jgi:hypothetical protein